MANVVLVGGGSGHGFKHGPEVGRYAAELAARQRSQPEPRFSLATKADEPEARSPLALAFATPTSAGRSSRSLSI